jgi:hypothetical protein
MGSIPYPFGLIWILERTIAVRGTKFKAADFHMEKIVREP